METVFLLLGEWWWIAPAAVGAGAAGYGALTTRRRRARRLELDAARHEVQVAYTAFVNARAAVRSAQADVLTARAQGSAGWDSLPGARRGLQLAKQVERSASLALRASRNRVKAAAAQYRAARADAPLPIERLMAQHDAVTSRWLEYETDAARALTYPQMLDVQHPATLAFLRAQREAQTLRPRGPRERIAPEGYVAYRDAVRALDAAFAEAERDAARTARWARG